MSLLSEAGRGRIAPLGFFFLGIAAMGWGLNFPIMKQLLSELPPLTSRSLAGLAGAAALALIAYHRGQRLAAPKRLWGRLILLSTLNIGGWVAFMGLALVWLKASDAAVLAITIPVWVSLLAWPLLGERVSLVRGLALIVALTGICVLIGGAGLDVSREKLPGIVFALMGAVSVAFGTVLTKRYPLALQPIASTAWQLGLGCLPVALIGLAIEEPHFAVLSPAGWASMAYLTLVQFCVCYMCWFAALERLPAATASIGTLLVPVVGVLAAAAMLSEPLGWRELTALAATLGSVALALRH